MHPEVERFLASDEVTRIPWLGARVIEVGAQDVNGAVRYLVPDTLGGEWLGIDLVDGPGVDYVGDAVSILPTLHEDGERFDIAISCEVLEHAPDWRSIVAGMLSVLKPGGFLVITCAGPGRPEHNANGAAELEPGEWYENVALADLRAVVECFDGRIEYGFQRGLWPQDTYLVATSALIDRGRTLDDMPEPEAVIPVDRDEAPEFT